MKMKTHRFSYLLMLSLMLAVLLLSACEKKISRNANGSLDVRTTISQQELQGVIQLSLADPLITELKVTLEAGYILAEGKRQRLNDPSKSDMLTFRLDLGVAQGHLTAAVSNALIDNIAVEQNRVSLWNQTIANRIENFGNRKSNVTLQSVSITSASVTMNWQAGK